jgi:hypothetical protein
MILAFGFLPALFFTGTSDPEADLGVELPEADSDMSDAPRDIDVLVIDDLLRSSRGCSRGRGE